MGNNGLDWTYFKRRIYIDKCSIEDLFLKWATPKGLTEWFVKSARYEFGNKEYRKSNEIIKDNDHFKWQFHIGSVITGTVLEVRVNSLVKFTFGKKEIDSNQDVIVTVTIHKNNKRCYVDILQENLSTSNYGKVYYYISCNMGWMFHMNNLKSIFEASHDLRIRGENRMHVDAPSGYPLDQFKWTEFRQLEYINAPREVVFNKWVTPKDITRWFIKEAIYSYDGENVRKPNERIEAGDRYTWVFYQGIEIRGTILSIKDNTYLKFTFGKKEPGSDEDVIVEIHFSSCTVNKTKIILHQMNIADSEQGHVNYTLSCILGWSYFLTNLRSTFESGFDLREKNKELALKSNSYTLARK